MRIVYMGTPDYAVPALRALARDGHEICCAVAQPDKPVGRKHVLTPPPVKVCAQELSVPVFQPISLKSEESQAVLAAFKPDLIVVVAYGKILPKAVLQLPKFGCVNGHASLLPKYRGASPIQWAILNGEIETGVTVMFMDEGLDTGDIIDSVKTEIGAGETAGELFDRLSVLNAELLVKTVRAIAGGTARRTPQLQTNTDYAPIIKKEMALLDFHKTADRLEREVRGFYPWPCSYFYLQGRRVKVVRARVGGELKAAPGAVFSDENGLSVCCGDKTALVLEEVIPEGGKRMSAADMLRGHPVKNGERVDNG